jgi:hypothetical protein
MNRFLIQAPYQQIMQQLGDTMDFILADTERDIRGTFMGVTVADKTEGQ